MVPRRSFFRASQLAASALALAALAACATLQPAPTETPVARRWWRGNVHTHTLWSDGDSAPEAVVDWYATHGYDFLVISDHNILPHGELWRRVGTGYKEARPEQVAELRARYGEGAVTVRPRAGGGEEMRLLDLAELRARFERPGAFLLMSGEEISDRFAGRPIHHGALNVGRKIAPPGGSTLRRLMRRTLRRIAAEGRRTGRTVLGHLNHPNYEWGVSAEDLAAVGEEHFFEVYNGHRLVRNGGDAEHPGTEAIWDFVLAKRLAEHGGPSLFALATDDAHTFREVPGVANPGRGWIVVRAAALDAGSLVRAMQAGDFYASSGVALRDVRRDGAGLSLEVEPQAGVAHTIRFVGTRGRRGDRVAALRLGETFAEVEGERAEYRFRGDELYVRAVVVSSRLHPNGYAPGDHETAWTQPAIPRRLPRR